MPSNETTMFVEQLLKLLAEGRLQRVEKPWGYEVIIETDEFLLKLIHVNDDARTSLQYHERKREVLMPVDGEGAVNVYQNNIVGQIYRGPIAIEPFTTHRTVGPLTLLEVTTLDNDDVVRVEDDYQR